jgi:uncharacterized protein (TIGR04255 family)
MAFPRSDRVVFKHNPLGEVICQLRFPTILSIVTEAPASFQERIRRIYPLYEKVDPLSAIPKDIASLVSHLPLNLPADTVVHKFSTADAKTSISLTPDYVALSDRGYTRWEIFLDQLRQVETGLREVFEPAFYTRVGLRYQNIIDRHKLDVAQYRWDELVQPYFAGLLAPSETRDRVRGILSDTLLQLDEVSSGSARIRSGFAQIEDSDTQVYVIDSDFFTNERCTSDDAFRALGIFNRLAGDLFRWAITPALQRALGPQTIN